MFPTQRFETELLLGGESKSNNVICVVMKVCLARERQNNVTSLAQLSLNHQILLSSLQQRKKS